MLCKSNYTSSDMICARNKDTPCVKNDQTHDMEMLFIQLIVKIEPIVFRNWGVS
jgi:hypothetical protein